jgi:hypothetical protein
MRYRDLDIRKRQTPLSGGNLDLRIWTHSARDWNDCESTRSVRRAQPACACGEGH